MTFVYFLFLFISLLLHYFSPSLTLHSLRHLVEKFFLCDSMQRALLIHHFLSSQTVFKQIDTATSMYCWHAKFARTMCSRYAYILIILTHTHRCEGVWTHTHAHIYIARMPKRTKRYEHASVYIHTNRHIYVRKDTHTRSIELVKYSLIGLF